MDVFTFCWDLNWKFLEHKYPSREQCRLFKWYTVHTSDVKTYAKTFVTLRITGKLVRDMLAAVISNVWCKNFRYPGSWNSRVFHCQNVTSEISVRQIAETYRIPILRICKNISFWK
jgi:arginyl-tRNA--protein-N-Asp/Glu arginylyltransferase